MRERKREKERERERGDVCAYISARVKIYIERGDQYIYHRERERR